MSTIWCETRLDIRDFGTDRLGGLAWCLHCVKSFVCLLSVAKICMLATPLPSSFLHMSLSLSLSLWACLSLFCSHSLKTRRNETVIVVFIHPGISNPIIGVICSNEIALFTSEGAWRVHLPLPVVLATRFLRTLCSVKFLPVYFTQEEI